METEEKSLTPEGVCRILETAARVGVRELKFSTLHFFLGSDVTTAQSLGSPPAPAPEMADTHQKIAEDALVQDEIAVRESQLAQMFIEDPMRAEQMLAEGDLVDEPTHGLRDEEA